jgi:hypothetical protein
MNFEVGDLVRYSGSLEGSNVIGIVLKVVVANNGNEVACAVQWANGVTSNHSINWLIKVKTSEDT